MTDHPLMGLFDPFHGSTLSEYDVLCPGASGDK
jgi:hypothetical protein